MEAVKIARWVAQLNANNSSNNLCPRSWNKLCVHVLIKFSHCESEITDEET